MTRIAHYALDLPPANVLSIAALESLRAEFHRLAASGADVVIWESGNERLFSAGVDLHDHTVPMIPAMLRAVHGLLRSFTELDALLIAQVHGRCLGGAAELVFGCDGVIASEEAEFGFPEIRVGCFPPIAAATLGARIGQAQATELILSGQSLPAAEAQALGLVNRVVPRARLAGEGEAYARELCEHSSRAVRMATLKLLRRTARRQWEEALTHAETAYHALPPADVAEGIAAFLEKRPPRWPDAQ